MSPDYQQVQQLAHALPVNERLMLASELLEDVEYRPFGEDDSAWEAEIARRVAEIHAGTAETCSLDELISDARSILSE